MKRDYVSVIYDEKVRPKTGYPNLLAAYLTKRFQLPAGATVLDAGCGRGDFALAFKKAGLNVIGLDLSPVSGQELDSSHITVYQTDVTKDSWPVADHSVDLVFSKSVIEHIHNPEHFMKETYRVLKTGGRVIVMTPDWENQMRTFYDDHTHVQPYTVRSLKKLLLMTGFREAAAEKFYQLPVLWSHPWMKLISRGLQIAFSPNPERKNKFLRWSVELMCLATGIK